MLTSENATGLITTATFDPGGQQTDNQRGQEPAEAMDPSLMLSAPDQSYVSMDMKDIFGDDDLFSDAPMETSGNPFDSLLSQAAAEAGVFPFMDDMDDAMDSTPTQLVQQPVVTNQLVIPAGQPVVSMPQPVGTMPQKVNTMPMFNQTLQPMIANQPGHATTAMLQVTPSGQQILQQMPANAQPGQQILIQGLQGLVSQLAPVKTSQGIIGQLQLQQGLQGQQQPLTSFVLNTGGTRIPIQTVVNSPMQHKLSKINKSGLVAISPKPSSKGPRHISPKPQPGQRVIQILPNQAVTRTLQIAPRAPGQPQTFLIRNPNMPGNLQLVQGISTGTQVINSSMVRAPNYQVIQGNNPGTMLPGRLTTQPSNTSTQSNTSSSRSKKKNNSQSNTQTTQSKSVAPLSSANLSSTALTNQLQGNFNALNYNFSQSVCSQPTIVTVTETDNKTSHPVITIGASGSMIVVKQSKPINVTTKNPGLGSQTVVTSVLNQKSMTHLPQPTVLSNQQHLILPPSSVVGGGQMKVMQSQPPISFDDISYQSMQVPSPQQLPGLNPTKQQNIPTFAHQMLSQSVPQTVPGNSSFVNTISNPAQYSTSVQSIGQQNVLNQMLPQQVSTPNISLTHRQLQIQSDNTTSSSFSVGLPLPQQSTQPLQGSPLVAQQPGTSQNQSGINLQNQSEQQQQKTRELQMALQRNPDILKELMRKHPTVFQNSFKNSPQMQQKLQTLFQQIQQQNPGAGNMQNLAANQSTIQQPQQIGPGGSLTLVHNQANAQAGVQASKQLIGAPNANVQDLLLNQPMNSNQNSNLGNSIQPIATPVISAQAAAIMKYPPKRSQGKNAKTASVPSVTTSSSINLSSGLKGVQENQIAGGTVTPSVVTPGTTQALNLPQTFQISIKAQEQLQLIQNHIRTLTGMQNLTDQQSRLLQELQLLQQKIVTQARQQMLVQQTTRPPITPNLLPQPASNKKIATKQTIAIASSGNETMTVKQEPANVVKTSNLTPSQQQIVRSFQEKLKSMTPEEQHAYIKSQQSLLLALQQQKQANQGQTSTGSQLIKLESKGTKRPAQYQLTRSSLMLHQIKQNQEKMTAPDLKMPFKSYKDAVHRLLNYHVSTDHTPTSKELHDIDEAFEEVSVGILEKKQKMYDKYQQLIMQDSMKTSESSEMVMLGRMMLQEEKAHFDEEKQLPQDQLIAKLRTLPGLKLIEDETDLESESIESDVKPDLISPLKIKLINSKTQDKEILPRKLETKSKSVQEIMKVETLEESTPPIDIVSPPLDHRTTDESADILEPGPKDFNGFIMRELPVDDDGRHKTLKLKIKLRRPSTLQDLLEEQDLGGDSEADESRPPTPTFDSSLNGESNQHGNSSYDVFEISDIDEDVNIVNDSDEKTPFVETQDENTQDESIGSNEDDEDRDDEFQGGGGLDTPGALSVQNQSAINHILSFRNNENVEIPTLQDDSSDIYESRDGNIVNGLEYEFDDDDDESIHDFSERENSIHKLDQDLDDFSSKSNSDYECSTGGDPDLEEAVNSILF